jgi:hypothetical protein
MPYSYRDLIVGVLRDLDEPDQHHPTVDQILQACGDVGQQLHNQLQNTSIGWNVASTPLPVPSGTGRYLIAAPNFGKALRLTAEFNDGNWQGEYQIDFTDRQNLSAFFKGNYSFASHDSFGSFYTEQVAVLEYENGAPVIQLYPDTVNPGMNYKLWYEVGETPQISSTEENFLPQVSNFHPYARTLISLRCLPYSEWTNLVTPSATREQKNAEWRKRREELRQSLAAFAVEQREDWSEYITTNRQTGSMQARAYADTLDQALMAYL